MRKRKRKREYMKETTRIYKWADQWKWKIKNLDTFDELKDVVGEIVESLIITVGLSLIDRGE